MFGWTAKEAIGIPLTQTIIPSSYHEAHVQGLKRFVATQKARVLNQQLECPDPDIYTIFKVHFLPLIAIDIRVVSGVGGR